MLDMTDKHLLTFDCYGTLIDWENGILSALKPVFSLHNIELDDNAILEAYGQAESTCQEGAFKPYRLILSDVMDVLGQQLGFTPTPQQSTLLAESIAHWQPFPDTIAALQALKSKYKLAILSNIDDDLFEHSARLLGNEFDWVVTAEQVQSYKPGHAHFHKIQELSGIAPSHWVHVAQSLHHDIIPSKALGIPNIWINRRADNPGFGATKPAQTTPDMTFPSLDAFAAYALNTATMPLSAH